MVTCESSGISVPPAAVSSVRRVIPINRWPVKRLATTTRWPYQVITFVEWCGH
jgi:hypothetical protein